MTSINHNIRPKYNIKGNSEIRKRFKGYFFMGSTNITYIYPLQLVF